MPELYIGTRNQMSLVPAPDRNMSIPKVGWKSRSQYLNGGAGVRSSTGSHKEYTMAWDSVTRDGIRPLGDYADGIHDLLDGINLIYFLDPSSMDKNVLPQLWASPFQQVVDALTLFPTQKPTIVETPENVYRYPARSAVYVSNAPARSLWVPIPPGHTAWVGVHGMSEGLAGLTVTPTKKYTAASPVLLPTLDVNTSQRFSNSFVASNDVDGLLLQPANNGPASTDRFLWAGTMMQVLKDGVTPQDGDFISGQGHSGCQFDDKLDSTVKFLGNLREGGDGRVAGSVKLIETGSWL